MSSETKLWEMKQQRWMLFEYGGFCRSQGVDTSQRSAAECFALATELGYLKGRKNDRPRSAHKQTLRTS